MRSKVKIGNALICDYATPGANGKNILVNVYSGDIIISKMPSSQNFGLYIELFFREMGRHEGFLVVSFKGNQIFNIPFNVHIQTIADPVVIAIQQLSTQLDGEGEINVHVKIDDEQIPVLSKKVRIGIVPNPFATAPPMLS